MRKLTVGKTHRLQHCATPDAKFIMLALDHRNNLRRALNPSNPNHVTWSEMVSFKQAVCNALAQSASAVLLDPEYGAAQAIVGGALPGLTGLIVAVEETGYTGDPTARHSAILPGWGVEQIARMGASAAKLLVYYHPESATAKDQERLIRQVIEECRKHEIPLFLEPLSFSLNGQKLTSAEKRRVVVRTAQRLTPWGVDVLKAEFPLDIMDEPDERVWADACAELSAASAVPWVLLSAGASFSEFERQTAVACRAGASGVLAGRAVWKEATSIAGAEQDAFLNTGARGRMQRLAAICHQYACPWTDFHPGLRDIVHEGWYQRY